MPLYNYQCDACEHVQEKVLILRVSEEADERPAKCPSCGAEGSMQRVIGGKYLIEFKGSGYYQTDYNNRNYQ